MVLRNETVSTGAALPHPDAKPEVLTGNGSAYFIGYLDLDGSPYSRESGYYWSRADADADLATGEWDRRQ